MTVEHFLIYNPYQCRYVSNARFFVICRHIFPSFLLSYIHFRPSSGLSVVHHSLQRRLLDKAVHIMDVSGSLDHLVANSSLQTLLRRNGNIFTFDPTLSRTAAAPSWTSGIDSTFCQMSDSRSRASVISLWSIGPSVRNCRNTFRNCAGWDS